MWVYAQAATQAAQAASSEPTPLIYGSLAAIVVFAGLVARVLASNNTRVDTAMQAQVTTLKEERDNARKDAVASRDEARQRAQEADEWRQKYDEERQRRMEAEMQLRLTRGTGSRGEPAS